jgi:hypothetical protein
MGSAKVSLIVASVSHVGDLKVSVVVWMRFRLFLDLLVGAFEVVLIYDRLRSISILVLDYGHDLLHLVKIRCSDLTCFYRKSGLNTERSEASAHEDRFRG